MHKWHKMKSWHDIVSATDITDWTNCNYTYTLTFMYNEQTSSELYPTRQNTADFMNVTI